MQVIIFPYAEESRAVRGTKTTSFFGSDP
eukprot:COSAG02_NODE_7557_length_2961_cov_9.324948_5_plen_28_part_01